jgi:hypothetical protein
VNRSTASDDLFIFVQGGGGCWNSGTCVPSFYQHGPLCDYATTCLIDQPGGIQPTGVFVRHPDPFPADGGGFVTSELNTVRASLIFDRTRADNPFRDATFVFVPYCTGDMHAGNRVRSYTYQPDFIGPQLTYAMHHVGARNMDAYLARLKVTLPNAQRVWLSGASGGGYGATLNFDRVQRAFPAAEVSLLADSAPMLTTARFAEWSQAWDLQYPQGYVNLDGGFPGIVSHLVAAYPQRRLGLLAFEQDRVIAWFMYAPPGLNNFLFPPFALEVQELLALRARYDATANAKYFILPGEEHVMLAGYGVVLADGGVTAARASADGGTTLRAWIDAWATGGSAWQSTP